MGRCACIGQRMEERVKEDRSFSRRHLATDGVTTGEAKGLGHEALTAAAVQQKVSTRVCSVERICTLASFPNRICCDLGTRIN